MSYNPASDQLSGYHPLDGTVEFYGRIRTILRAGDTVVDIGAGRGHWFHADKCEYRRELRDIRPRVTRFVGLDVDPAVLDNATTTENHVITLGKIPLPDSCADVVIADYVLEHVTDPVAFAAEVARILKPGGYFAARTPGKWEYVSIAARIIRNRRHAMVLERAQPGGRKALDVFPTAYCMNTLPAIRQQFKGWQDFSYLYSSEPSYYFGRKWLFDLMSIAHRILPRATVSNLFVFLRKPC